MSSVHFNTNPPDTYWACSLPNLEKAFQTSSDGLTEDEARERQRQYGPNTIRERQRFSAARLVLQQILNPLILTLVIAGGVTTFLGEWTETIVITVTVIVNTSLGFWQERKAQTILESLSHYIRTRVRVRRSDRVYEIDATELVPGDVISLQPGDRIPADARAIAIQGLEVDESILTGESLPVTKELAILDPSTVLAERKNMLHSGTLVIQGTAEGIITATGEQTAFGQIAALSLATDSDPTPLQRAVSRFARGVGIALLILITGVFVIGMRAGYAPLDIFLVAVAMAISAIPEGLPIALTVILAVGVERLAKKKGVVRKLLAAETLGSTSLILTDKTGTLTQARMTLSTVLPANPQIHQQELIRTALHATDAIIENPEDPRSDWRITGKPMEVALVQEAIAENIALPSPEHERIDQLPFHSAHKYSVTIIRAGDQYQSLLVGAPDIILRFTTLSPADQQTWQTELTERTLTGERFLGIAWKYLPDQQEAALSRDTRPQDFTFGGLIGFRDPLRPHMKEVIQRIAASGVSTVIVTGDHRGTAEAIARSLGLMHDARQGVMTGEEFARLSPEEQKAHAPSICAYARVTPEQKSLLVQLYQELGHVVAVTGDGVNDAPALQRADIGVAVGSGTEVAKGAADLVILDNNFQTIVVAIEEGRRMLNNIKKTFIYLLSNSLDDVLLIGGSMVLGLPLPLNALQILYVNLFMDSFPAISFAFEEQGNASQRTSALTSVFDKAVRSMTLSIVFCTGIPLFLLYVFLVSYGHPVAEAQTFIFAAFATHTLCITFCLRDLQRPIWQYNPFSNISLTISSLMAAIFVLAAIYLPPLQQALQTVPLSPIWLIGVLGFGLFSMMCAEVSKYLFQRPSSPP